MTAKTTLNRYIPLVLIILLLAISGCLESTIQENTLKLSTEKAVYHSNETLKVHVYFNSTKDANANIRVSGIQNVFGRAMLEETRETALKKGNNSFDFEFITPSCEECSAVSPGKHFINATLSIGTQTYESYSVITLERENATVSQDLGGNTTATGQTPEKNQTEPALTKRNANTILVEYFYDPACQKCAKAAPVIDSVVNSYADNVSFSKYNILTDEGLALAKKYQLPGVPSVVINEQKLISYADYDGNTTRLEELLRDSIEKASSLPAGTQVRQKIVLSVPSVFVVGFLAGFNPCLLAILAFIASVTLATTGKRRNVLLIVLMFSLGIFVTYLIVGIGLLNIIEQMPSIQASIKNFLVILIAVLGLWHVYDAWHLRSNTESSFYTPKAFIRLTESVTKNVSLPASFFMGALFSLIKAPCVGAVYFVILDMVRSGSGEGMLYLAAYNFGVVLPVLVLGFAIAFGLNPEKVEKFRKEKRSVMRLFTGLTLLAIAVLMYAGII
ncbi:Thiol:disulfide interchange protein DsbD [uncultured archaeon]|nr:Thiol:disulfide interchange protein DsbD [uncultured archaeon]